jgi:glycosyltransferase involved in cell wall biosynthesis
MKLMNFKASLARAGSVVDRHPKPLISCVISNFNYEQFVGQAVGTALAQTRAFHKVIVVDDGSSDRSLEMLHAFGDRIVLIAVDNGGQTSACLRGLAEVETDYVYFLDADDYLSPDFVATVEPLLADAPTKVQFQLETVSARTGAIFSPFPTYADHYDSEAMRSDNKTTGFYRSPPTSGNVFNVAFLRSIDHSLLNPRSAIDSTLNLVAPYFGPVTAVNMPLAFRRVHEDSFGQWSRPTPELLQKELGIFLATWREAILVLKWREPPYGRQKPLYVLERELMIQALSGKTWLLSQILRFHARVLRSREPAKQRLLLMLWAASLIVPVARLRETIIWARRSPVNRPAALERIVRFVARK